MAELSIRHPDADLPGATDDLDMLLRKDGSFKIEVMGFAEENYGWMDLTREEAITLRDWLVEQLK